MNRPDTPVGASLPELLVALVALGILATVAVGLFRIQNRVALAVSVRAEALDATRTTAALITRELRFLADDDAAFHGDSVVLRAFRGAGVVCDATGASAVVRYEGVRDPDPAKDSAIVIVDSVRVVPITAVAPAASPGCTPRTTEVVLAVGMPLAAAPGALLAVFERGAYSIGTASLRYRRGAGGRQPVTAAVFDDAGSRFLARPTSAAAGAAAEVRLEPAAAQPMPGLALPAIVRVAQPNADTLEHEP